MTCSLTVGSPAGPLTLTESGGALVRIVFGDCGGTCRTPLLDLAARQIEEYFAGRRTSFQLPLAPSGTPFQLSVWQALQSIPYGQTRSYSDIACAVGRPRACRAAGMANNRNPLPIVIPCHRVIGASGALTGYASGLHIKRLLLELESRHTDRP
ncbi:MAG: methylated-DNA--[protein]-cysteine S-methyltransferase [Alistipes sp.]|nr:methylated-DNA--[protein]-cysteine S-methyltransferase [Alistipes sp.]